MTAYRKIQVQQDAYMVSCDNCGKEDGPYPSPPPKDRPYYCNRCGPTCRQNEAFRRYAHFMGGRVVGFKFSRFNEPELHSVVLKKGKQLFVICSPATNEDDDEGHALVAYFPVLPLSQLDFVSKERKVPKRRKSVVRAKEERNR